MPCGRRSTITNVCPILAARVALRDDASNNKWLVSGKGALIMNPPSAWAVAKRDAPKIAEQTVDTRHAGGAQGTLRSIHSSILGIWSFSKNKAAAKSLLAHLSQPARDREIGGGQRRL